MGHKFLEFRALIYARPVDLGGRRQRLRCEGPLVRTAQKVPPPLRNKAACVSSSSPFLLPKRGRLAIIQMLP